MKKNIATFIIIMVISAVVLASVGMIYSFYFRDTIRGQYQLIYAESIENSGMIIDKTVENAFDALRSHNGIGIPVGYYGVGTLTPLATGGGTLTIKSADRDTYTTIDADTYRVLTGIKAKNDGKPHYSCGTFFGGNKKFIIYALPIINLNSYAILYQDYSVFVESINRYSLDNVVITDLNGLVTASGEAIDFSAVFGENGFSYNFMGDIEVLQNKYVKRNGADNFIVIEKLTYGNYYALGYLAAEKIDAVIQKDISRNTIFVVMVGVVSFLGSGIIIMVFLIISHTYVAGSIANGKYSLFVNKKGKILARNSKFSKEFDNISTVFLAMENEFNPSLQLSDKDAVFKLKNKKEETVYIRFICSPTIYGYRLLGTDATKMSLEYLRAVYLSNCDAVTKLPNQVQLELDYERVLKENPNEQMIFQYVEIIGTEQYKAMFSISFAEKVKINFAQRLLSLFPDMVYHIGETLFVVFAKTTAATQKLISDSSAYIAQLDAPFHIDTQNLIIDFKGGRCKPFFSKDNPPIAGCLDQARKALQTAIYSADKKVVAFFDALAQSDMAVYEDRQSIIDLINDNMLEMYFQPQYSLKTNCIVGFESLLRLKKKLNLSILEFIEHAERNGGIIEVGYYVTEAAMVFAKKIEKHKISISINVSPVQLMQEGFIEGFLELYRKYELKPGSIAIEITESFLMTNYTRAIKLLNLLSKAGIAIHLDDFGVVYSSMLYLKKLPIDLIKIDREFVKDITFNAYSQMIVQIITQSSKHLKLKCVAEGVETEDQVKMLRSLDPDIIIQGYYISKAVSGGEAENLIEKYISKNETK